MPPTLAQAIALAASCDLHEDNRNSTEPLAVTRRMRIMATAQERFGNDEKLLMASVMHDMFTKPDAVVTENWLLEEGYDTQFIKLLQCLVPPRRFYKTLIKTPDQEREFIDFIRTIRRGPVISQQVMICRLVDDLDRKKIRGPRPSDYSVRKRLYRLATHILSISLAQFVAKPHQKSEHYMKLDEEGFDRMKAGIKKVEARLLDDKRKLVRPGDTIHFIKQAKSFEEIIVDVLGVYIYDSFEHMANFLDPQFYFGRERADIIKRLYERYTEKLKGLRICAMEIRKQ